MTTFSTVLGGRKVACSVCGRTGYPGGTWQDACRAGHPHACWCGRRFTRLSGLSAHTRPRRPGAAPRHQETR